MGVRVSTLEVHRQALAHGMDLLVAHAAHGVTWKETRPIPRVVSFAVLEHIVATTGLATDCSGSSVVLCQQAGLESPTGVYDGEGDTQTIYDHLTSRYTNPAAANVGAFCWFGIPGDLASQHLTMVRHPGKDPVLFSLGENPGPRYLPLSVERTAHVGEVVFLSITHLIP